MTDPKCLKCKGLGKVTFVRVIGTRSKTYSLQCSVCVNPRQKKLDALARVEARRDRRPT